METKEEKKVLEVKEEVARRSFLKKAIYAVPTLIVMGQLARPTKSDAIGPPQSQP
jgi:hypothetical protein